MDLPSRLTMLNGPWRREAEAVKKKKKKVSRAGNYLHTDGGELGKWRRNFPDQSDQKKAKNFFFRRGREDRKSKT